MKIAVIGSGIAGLSAAWHLSPKNNIVLFEKNNHVGGHTRTLSIKKYGKIWEVDTGFVVFNQKRYPGLYRFLKDLGMSFQSACMSFSLSFTESKFEYQGSSLSGYFAKRSMMFSPSHVGMLLDIVRFHFKANQWLLDKNRVDCGIKEWAYSQGLGQTILERYLLPIGAALWSCGTSNFAEFSADFVLRYMSNHGMLQLGNRPVWKTIVGGSSTYVRALLDRMDAEVRLCTAVCSVRRVGDGVEIDTDQERNINFDHAIIACHADQALDLVQDMDLEERKVLNSFPYKINDIVLHQDRSLLPCLSRAQASWNYLMEDGGKQSSITYNMSRLQGLDSPDPFLVTLNNTSAINPKKIIYQFQSGHPTYHFMGKDSQARHSEFIDRQGISYCGAYWGWGFHEDGFQSGMRVVEKLKGV